MQLFYFILSISNVSGNGTILVCMFFSISSSWITLKDHMNSLNLGNHVYVHFFRQRFTALILQFVNLSKKKKKRSRITSFINRLILSDSHQLVKAAAAAAKSLQSCPALCDPTDGSPPSSPIPGILQARTLEWVAISFSNAGKWKVKVKSLSCVWLFKTPWTAAHQAPPSMGFSRQEYWSGVPLPSPSLLLLPYSK